MTFSPSPGTPVAPARRGPKFFAIRVLVPVMAVVAMLAVNPTKAEAFQGLPHWRCGSPGGIMHEHVCVAWTGGWPHGIVRAEAKARYWHALKLRTCSDEFRACTDYIDAAHVQLNGQAGFTSSVRVGKYSWYIACGQRFPTSGWACYPVSQYLGD